MRISLDIKKSKETGWIVIEKHDFQTMFNYFTNLFWKIFFGGFTLVIVYGAVFKPNRDLFMTSLLLTFFLFGFIGLYGSLLGDKFVRFRGTANNEKNREIILKFFKTNYPNNNFFNGSEYMSSYKKPKGFFKCIKSTNRIFVLFDNNDILINISDFTSEGMQSPFSTIYHHLTINKLKREFST